MQNRSCDSCENQVLNLGEKRCGAFFTLVPCAKERLYTGRCGPDAKYFTELNFRVSMVEDFGPWPHYNYLYDSTEPSA